MQASGTTLFQQSRTFDAVGNVQTSVTTLPAGTDTQAFCYDNRYRLTWAGDLGTPPCGGTASSTISGTSYSQAYSADVLDRLATGPLGSYTYGDPNHLDAVTSAPGYTAGYDAAGDMTSRNGQVLGYDNLRRLIAWQNTASNPTSTASYAYDGEGNRVQQVVTANGTTTTTNYIGGFEDISTTYGTTTTTKYYDAGVAQAVNVNGTISYLANDSLGSVTVALDNAGNVTATELYVPFGGVRYATGTMPTSFGFTGQRLDPSGLMYFHARYYDPTVGQFTSADLMQGPNRYNYVGNNPSSSTDPSGNGVAPTRPLVDGCGSTNQNRPAFCMGGPILARSLSDPSSWSTPCTGMCLLAVGFTALMVFATPFYTANQVAMASNAPGVVQLVTGVLAGITGEDQLGSVLLGAATITSPGITMTQAIAAMLYAITSFIPISITPYTTTLNNNDIQNYQGAIDAARQSRPAGGDFGGSILTDSNGNIIDQSPILWGHQPYGSRANGGMHLENQVLYRLSSNSGGIGSGSYDLHVFTELPPCREYCADWIRSGTYAQEAGSIIGGNVNVIVHTRGGRQPGRQWYTWKP